MDASTRYSLVNRPRIYLDYAATTPLDPEVWRIMNEHALQLGGNPSSIHAEGRAARTAIEEARKSMARLLHASLNEVFFTSCGTESNNTILLGAVRDLRVRRIISSPIEHHCILHTLEYLKTQYPLEVVYLPITGTGQPDLQQLAELLNDQPGRETLVSLMQVNNEIGSMIDLQYVGDLVHQYGALFHSDTVQAVGFDQHQLSQLPIDFMSGSAHKFYGPKGIGFMYIRNEHILQPLLYGGSQERNIRSGTENILGILGMARALELAMAELDNRQEHMRAMKARLMNGLLAQVPGVTFNAIPAESSAKILSVNIPAGPRTDLLLMNLDIAGISASGGSACSSGVESASHVLSHLPIDSTAKTVRFSFSHLTTALEIDQVIEEVSRLTALKTA